MTSTIQSIPVDPTPPASGEGLIFNGTVYVPTPANPGDITAVNTTLPLTGGGVSGALTLDINNFTGDSGAGGLDGAVPAPAAGDAAAGKYLKADGAWTVPPAGGALLVTSVNMDGLLTWPGGDISFETEEVDTLGAFSLGTPDTFTIPSNGVYEITAAWYANMAGSAGTLTNVNRITLKTPKGLAGLGAESQIPITVGGAPGLGINVHEGSYTWMEYLTLGTTFKVNVFVNGPGNQIAFVWMSLFIKKLS